MRRTLALVALLLGLAPMATASPGRFPLAASDSTAELGANTGMLFNSHRYSRAAIDAQLAALARTGATTVRSDAPWETAEPKAPTTELVLTPPFFVPVHHYNWRMDDKIAGMLAAHGLRWLPIIDYSTSWAQSISGDDHSAPSSVSDYAAYAAAVAARYGPGGTFWHDNPQLTPLPVDTYEIWNEPDSHVFWHPSPDAAAYGRLYTRARGAIAATQPSAHVLIGGLTRPASFVPELLAANPTMRGQLDGVAIHPYGATPEYVLSSVRTARIIMRAAGLGMVPLYVTEFGWTTHPAKVWAWAPESLRPLYISRTLAALSRTDCGIADVLIYAWVTPEHDTSDREDWYGISPPDATGSPATRAFSAALRAAAPPGPVYPLCAGPDPLPRLHKPSTQLRSHLQRRSRHHHARKHRPKYARSQR